MALPSPIALMPPDENKFWFPAKSHGWGWGLPCRWQGWAVMIAYFALLSGGALFFSPVRYPAYYLGYVVILSLALTVICAIKGEKPRWRWGGKD